MQSLVSYNRAVKEAKNDTAAKLDQPLEGLALVPPLTFQLKYSWTWTMMSSRTSINLLRLLCKKTTN